MKREFKLTRKLELSDLEGLQINGASFELGKGMYTSRNTIIMNIPKVFRFSTQLEIAESDSGDQYLILAQFLTRGPEMWEMEEGFSRIGFQDPEIREQMEQLCENLVSKGLAEWIEVRKQYFDKNKNLIEAGMKIKSDIGEVGEVFLCKEDGDELGLKERPKSANVCYTVDEIDYFPLFQFDLNQWEIVKS